MPEPKDLLLESLKETLKGAEKYFVAGGVSALFILLLAVRGQLAPGATEQDVKIPILELNAPTFGAAFIALAIYILSGWKVCSFINHVDKIKSELTRLKQKELLDAALTYPSMILTGTRMPVVSALLVAALGIGAMLASYYESNGFGKAVGTGFIISLPYFTIALYLWRWPLHKSDDTSSSEQSQGTTSAPPDSDSTGVLE